MNLTEKLKFYKDFPKEGINFVDIMPLIQDRETYLEVEKQLAASINTANLATVEARGFLFATSLLMMDSTVKNVIPIRKRGKLPFAGDDLQKVAIVKEYGEDIVTFRISDIAAGEANGDTFEVTLFDDVLATGGTAEGLANAINAIKIEKDGKVYNVKIKEFVFLVELDDLKGADRLSPIAPVNSIIHL